ncbi:MAG: Flp family type IVb pilin [Methylocystis sp.]
MRTISRFLKDERGATAIEYGLVAVFMGIAVITALNAVGQKLQSTFNDVANNLAS